MNKPLIKHILWDWNGTLLNDVDESIATMNELLTKRQLPTLTKRRYQAIFDFPVYDYYQVLGFDFSKEEWTDVAAEYMNSYHKKEVYFKLFNNAKKTLEILHNKGYQNYILSAMQQESIEKMLSRFEIAHFFNGVYGLDNHYANGKVDNAHLLLKEENLNPQNCLLLGDTVHDAHVAKSIHVNCALIGNGHHSFERLSATQNPTYKSIDEWLNKF